MVKPRGKLWWHTVFVLHYTLFKKSYLAITASAAIWSQLSFYERLFVDFKFSKKSKWLDKIIGDNLTLTYKCFVSQFQWNLNGCFLCFSLQSCWDVI